MKFEMKNRLKPCAAVSIAIMVVALVMTVMGMGIQGYAKAIRDLADHLSQG